MGSRVQSVIEAVPVTVSRPVPEESLSKVIENPGAPRANVAVSKENPEGKTDSEQLWRTRPEKTVLQQHVDLWTDENGCADCLLSPAQLSSASCDDLDLQMII